MKNVSRLVACVAIALGMYTPAHAQRAVGARSINLDDGLGNVVVITIPSPSVSGTYTIPSGGGSATPNGTVTGQMLRWNAGTVPPSWEIGTATNVGANMSIGAGTMTASNFLGNLNGETNAQLHTASLLTGAYAALNGSAITNLNASNLASGTVADARLSANVPLLNAGQTFTGANVFSNAASTFAGNAATATTASGLTAAAWASPGTIGSTTPNTGSFTTMFIAGATTINKNTNVSTEINDGTSTGNVFIGNAAGGTQIFGPILINRNTNSNTEINDGTSTGNVVIGNAGTGVQLFGSVQINKNTNSTTEINNGTSTGAVAIGNAAASVLITSGTWGVNILGAANFVSVSPTLMIGAGAGTGTTASNKYADHYTVDAVTTGVGTATITINNSKITAASVVVATIQASANVVAGIKTAVPGAGTLTVTSVGATNWTAGDVINYIIVTP